VPNYRKWTKLALGLSRFTKTGDSPEALPKARTPAAAATVRELSGLELGATGRGGCGRRYEGAAL